MNPVDKHLAAQAEKFAPRNEPFKDSVERLSWENIRRGERHAFLAGAALGRELGKLEGYLQGLGCAECSCAELVTECARCFMENRAKVKLEKLLSEKGEG